MRGSRVGTLSFNHNIENVVQVVESVGVAILVVGGLLVMVHSGVLYVLPARRARAYHYFRKHLGRVILLGLEVLIVADIIRTVIVDQPRSVWQCSLPSWWSGLCSAGRSRLRLMVSGPGRRSRPSPRALRETTMATAMVASRRNLQRGNSVTLSTLRTAGDVAPRSPCRLPSPHSECAGPAEVRGPAVVGPPLEPPTRSCPR